MQYVKDVNNFQWEIKVNVNTLRRIKALCGVDLMELISVNEKTGNMNTELLERLSSDPILLVDILYATCKPQADEKNITDEQFGELWVGDQIEVAVNTLLGEIINFFPEAKRKVWQKIKQASEMTAQKEKNELLQELDKISLEDLASRLEMSGEQSMNMPVSAE
jgi:hypothetical protein